MRSQVIHRGLGVAGIAAVMLLGACSSTSTQVSDEIASQVKDQLELDEEPTVTCPDDAEAGKGESFTCTIDIGGDEVAIDVTFKDDTNFTSDVQGGVFEKATIDEALAKDLGEAGVEVDSFDCEGGTVVVIAKDATITCTVTGTGGGTAEVLVGLDDDDKVMMPGSLYLKEDLDASVVQMLGENDIVVESVECGEDELIPANEDTTIDCTATDSADATATVTVALGADGTAVIEDVVPD